jgi:DNA-binding NtrC family response regulator
MFRQALVANTPYNVVILDLTIPGGIGGMEVVQAIHALAPDTTAIVSSGYADSAVMSNFESYGFSGVLAKPYTETQLHDTLTQALQSA